MSVDRKTRGIKINFKKLSEGEWDYKIIEQRKEQVEDIPTFTEVPDDGIKDNKQPEVTVEKQNKMAEAKPEDSAAETSQLFELSMDDLAEKLKEAKAERQKIEQEEQKRKQILELVQLQEENERRKQMLEQQKLVKQVKKKEEDSDKKAAADELNIEAIRKTLGLDKKASQILKGFGVEESDSEEEDSDPTHKLKEKSDKGRKLRSGMEAKASDIVINPQIWPHVALQIEHVGRNYAFHELDLRLLVAGELEIIMGDNVSEVERMGRLSLLQGVAYVAGSHDWNTARSLYAAAVRKVELGLLNWGSDFSKVEQTVLSKAVARGQKGRYTVNFSSGSSGGSTSQSKTDNRTWYCRAFQYGKCSLAEPHTDRLATGKTVNVIHICAECWTRDKKKLNHPQGDSQCPNTKKSD